MKKELKNHIYLPTIATGHTVSTSPVLITISLSASQFHALCAEHLATHAPQCPIEHSVQELVVAGLLAREKQRQEIVSETFRDSVKAELVGEVLGKLIGIAKHARVSDIVLEPSQL